MKVGNDEALGSERQSASRKLRKTVENFRGHLDELEAALVEFEEIVLGGEPAHLPDQGFRYLTVTEISDRYQLNRNWVYRRVTSGEIPSVKFGRVIRVREADLEEYLRSQVHTPPYL